MDIDEIKTILNGYEDLKKKAEAVLIAGEKRFEDVTSVSLEDDEIGIFYDVGCRGETFHEYEHVPIEFFVDGTELKVEWAALKDSREKKWKRIDAAARRAEARNLKRKELAELRRLKKKYPDA